MNKRTLIFGPPGCGKTHTLIESVRDALSSGVEPDKIGFVSFTRKAVAEALDRACKEFSLDKKQLPFFKTLHSIAFHGLRLETKDMLGKQDWGYIGSRVGLIFNNVDTISPDDGHLLPSIMENNGAKYIQLIMRAKYRGVSLEQEFNDANDYNLDYNMMLKVNKEIISYKQKQNKYDFTDLIDKYRTIDPPHLDLLIVDEAQDLTPLQWLMIEHMSGRADRVIFAGDDDQAIHKWTGVDVNLFMNCTDNIKILEQSYRMPKKIYDLSRNICNRIRGRMPKQFKPTSFEGEVHYHGSFFDIPLDQGSWTIMARTNKMVKEFASKLIEEGYLYSLKGYCSVSQKVAEIMITWKRIQEGDRLPVYILKSFYKNVSKQGNLAVVKRGSSNLLEAYQDDEVLDYYKLKKDCGLVAPIERDAMDVARLGDQEKLYIKSLQRRGEDISQPPRIKLSTFHAMKGGEDDHCVVYLGTTQACINSEDQDSEHRAFYVGITRAKKTLHLLETDKKYRYEI